MKVNWKEVPRGDIAPQWAGIYVTMNRKGEIAMSRRTWERRSFRCWFKLQTRI
ncbi:MAG: hypothetical protein ABI999_01800 [Acidobacteriota bacterium]